MSPANIYLFRVNKRNNRKRREILRSNLTSGVFTINFEHITRVSIVDFEQVNVCWFSRASTNCKVVPKNIGLTFLFGGGAVDDILIHKFTN